jgi:hypothetical protein
MLLFFCFCTHTRTHI